MNLILFKAFFMDKIIYFFLTLLTIIIIINEIYLLKKELKTFSEYTKIEKIRIGSIIFGMATIFIFFILLTPKYILSFFIILFIFLNSIKVLELFISNNYNFNIDQKHYYLNMTILFLMFFSINSSTFFAQTFSNMNHTLKEIIAILYIIIKLILFFYIIIIDTFITINQIKNFKLFKKKSYDLVNKEIKIFFFKEKYFDKSFLIIVVIYILSPLLILINLIKYLFLKLISSIVSIIIKMSNFENNKETFIKKTIEISTIVSIFITISIVIFNQNFFSSNISEIFKLIATVILIPIIYDNIKILNKY